MRSQIKNQVTNVRNVRQSRNYETKGPIYEYLIKINQRQLQLQGKISGTYNKKLQKQIVNDHSAYFLYKWNYTLKK